MTSVMWMGRKFADLSNFANKGTLKGQQNCI